MKVRAKKKVYYDNKRFKVGQVFELKSDKHFSEEAMEKIGGKAEAKAEPKAKAEAKA